MNLFYNPLSHFINVNVLIPAMDYHPIQGGVEILLVASCYRNRDKLQPDGPQLARMQTLPFFCLDPVRRIYFDVSHYGCCKG